MITLIRPLWPSLYNFPRFWTSAKPKTAQGSWKAPCLEHRETWGTLGIGAAHERRFLCFGMTSFLI